MLNKFDENKVTLYIDGVDYDFSDATKATNTYTWSKKADYFTVSAGDKVSVKVM